MMEMVTNILDTNDINNYQVADKIIAKNIKGAPRFDTAIWPGYNVTITTQIEDNEKAAKLLDLLRDFNKKNSSNCDELLTVCSWEMDQYFFD